PRSGALRRLTATAVPSGTWDRQVIPRAPTPNGSSSGSRRQRRLTGAAELEAPTWRGRSIWIATAGTRGPRETRRPRGAGRRELGQPPQPDRAARSSGADEARAEPSVIATRRPACPR